jgi:hypothetical protein
VTCVGCSRPRSVNGLYAATFEWDLALKDLKIDRIQGDVLTSAAKSTIDTQLAKDIGERLAKANLSNAKGNLNFSVSGKPPYVLLLGKFEITEPDISDLMLAVEREDTSTIASLVFRYHNVNQKELPSQRTALHNASSGGKANSASQLLALGADPNIPDFEGDTPLIAAVAANNLAIAKALISAGAKVNQANQNGVTPLMRASKLGRTEMVKLLLRSGASQDL